MSAEPRGGPPRNDEAQVRQDLGDIEATGNHTNTRFYLRRCVTHPRRATAQDTLSQMKRRQSESRRHISLDCGCRDPWTCRCTQPPLSDKMIDAGGVPLLKIEVLQALWRRGGSDRQLAEQLHAATGGEIA
ncbi:MAG: hypothetical protein QOH91_1606 [Mycobacterium sp.]|nr:hypothetical protein [Mycobacterium sp.]